MLDGPRSIMSPSKTTPGREAIVRRLIIDTINSIDHDRKQIGSAMDVADRKDMVVADNTPGKLGKVMKIIPFTAVRLHRVITHLRGPYLPCRSGLTVFPSPTMMTRENGPPQMPRPFAV